jgi:hypothetical protein
VSIVRIGLAETKKFSDGYDVIFKKKKAAPTKVKPKAKTKSKVKARGAKKARKTAGRK